MSRIRGLAPRRPGVDTRKMDETGQSTTTSDTEDGPRDIAPVDVQHLLTWYFDVVHPGRHHITSRQTQARIVV